MGAIWYGHELERNTKVKPSGYAKALVLYKILKIRCNNKYKELVNALDILSFYGFVVYLGWAKMLGKAYQYNIIVIIILHLCWTYKIQGMFCKDIDKLINTLYLFYISSASVEKWFNLQVYFQFSITMNVQSPWNWNKWKDDIFKQNRKHSLLTTKFVPVQTNSIAVTLWSNYYFEMCIRTIPEIFSKQIQSLKKYQKQLSTYFTMFCISISKLLHIIWIKILKTQSTSSYFFKMFITIASIQELIHMWSISRCSIFSGSVRLFCNLSFGIWSCCVGRLGIMSGNYNQDSHSNKTKAT